jgi:hypothetical protein
MKKLIKIKPIRFLFMLIGLVPLLFLLVFILVKLLGPAYDTFNVLLFFGVFVSFNLLWINTIFLSIDLLNQKHNLPSRIKQNRLVFLILGLTYILRMIIALPPLNIIELTIGIYINLLIGIEIIIFFTYLFYSFTDDYIFHFKSRTPNVFDYFIIMFLFCLFPFGLIMLHSNIRSMLKDITIIEI